MSDASQRTEEPTPRRRQQAREKGNVALSRELVSACVLFVGIFLINIPGKQVIQAIIKIMRDSIFSITEKELNLSSLRDIVFQDLSLILPATAFLLIGLLIAGSLVTLLQTNFLWAGEKVGLKLDKIKLNPFAWFSRVFSTVGLVEFLKALGKLILISLIAYVYLKSHIPDFLGLAPIGLPNAFEQWGKMTYELGIRIAFAFLVLAILDYLFQRYQMNKQLKMTKQEVKDERVQAEGNPVIRRAVRTKQQRMAMMRMMSQVPKADVIITNPTHLAIAIQYDPATMQAPVVLAKGQDHIAAKIVSIAKENDIPIVQNIPLAHSLYKTVEIDQAIPPELYMAVAEVLVYIFKLRQKIQTAPSIP